MTPESAGNSLLNLKMVKENTKTYRIDWENGVIDGMCDGKEALKQAIRKILGTERYVYTIYSFGYGIETGFEKYNGKSVFPILKKNIEEALLQDDRISEVKDFVFSKDGGNVSVKFTVVSSQGEMIFEKAVDNIV